jgi:hypothetical protein
MKSIKTSTFKKIIGSAFLSLAALTTQAVAAMPSAFQADYTVAKGSMKLGNLHTSLKINGNRYAYNKYTKSSGLAALLTGIKITENTSGQISGQNLRPTSYLFNQSKHTKSKIDKIQFAGNSAKGNYKGKAYSEAISGVTQDRASLELVLARDVALNKAKLSYSVVERGRKKQYNFQKLGNEKVQVPAGAFNTVKVKVQRAGGNRETIFWLAKETGYMPVKIRHREKKDVITTVMRSYKKL